MISTAQLQLAIVEIDARLAREPGALSLRIDRGQFLEMLGRRDEAVATYVDVLRYDPTHVEALAALGLLFIAVGNMSAARTALTGAVLHGPEHAGAHAHLAYLQLLDDELTDARRSYEHALRLDPQLANAHAGLAQLLDRIGDEAGALEHRSLGLQSCPVTIGRYNGTGRPIHVLALGTAARGNIPTYGFFDDRVFLLASVNVEHVDLDAPLPPHDLVFNAIGEADLCAQTLAKAAVLLRQTEAPVINAPDIVARTSRVENARRLGCIAGVVTPRIVSFARALLVDEGAAARLSDYGFSFPLLVRSPGHHTGDHFSKVDAAADLRPAVDALPGDELLAIEFLDGRRPDAEFCKYRVIIVDGSLYPLHLAISRAWKVHYFSADMADRGDHRRADGAFLTDMGSVLGAPAVATLERIAQTLGLDYGGIDFTLDAAGNVVVFEANASMVVPTPGPDAIWNYRREPVARIRAAIRRMLVRRAADDGQTTPARRDPAELVPTP